MLGRRLWVIRPTRGRSRRQRSESLKPFDNTCHSVSYSLSFSQDADARQTSSYPSHFLSLSLFHHSRHDAYTLTTTQAYELTVYSRQSLTRIISFHKSSHLVSHSTSVTGVDAPVYELTGRRPFIHLFLIASQVFSPSLYHLLKRSLDQMVFGGDDVEME